MFANMFQIELKKFLKNKLFWIELFVFTLLTMLVFCGLFVVTNREDISLEEAQAVSQIIFFPESVIDALNMGSTLGAYLVIVLTGVSIAKEYHWGTYALYFCRGISRKNLLAAKFSVLLVASIIVILYSVLLSSLISIVFTITQSGTIDVSQLILGEVFFGILRTSLTILPYLALTFWLSITTRSIAGGIGISTAFNLIIEPIGMQLANFIGGSVEKISHFLPAAMNQALLQLNNQIINAQSAVQTELNNVDITSAIIGLSIYTLVFIGFAWLSFEKQDIAV
jgi:ABC-2 type transport system permease protein